MKKEWALLTVSIVFSLALCEVGLRIWNPFGFRVKGGEIVLPANQRWVLKNPNFRKLDKVIVHTKNSLGFRGPEPPPDMARHLSILAVGGSTTECFYVPDGKDWPVLLGTKLRETHRDIWVNNAGLDGQSTVGHLVLLHDYILALKPKMILFLVGANDIGREDQPNFYEKLVLRDRNVSWKDYLAKHSELVNMALNIGRVVFGKKAWLGDSEEMDLRTCSHGVVPPGEMAKALAGVGGGFSQGYKERLSTLVRVARQNGIDPVLVTQPALLGAGIDPITGVNLETVNVGRTNGLLYWRMFEIYNDVTRDVAREEGVYLVDLAHQLPKSSQYFYDTLHFTNEGAAAVADILSREVGRYLDMKYPDYKKG